MKLVGKEIKIRKKNHLRRELKNGMVLKRLCQ